MSTLKYHETYLIADNEHGKYTCYQLVRMFDPQYDGANWTVNTSQMMISQSFSFICVLR